jgi:hypothetical protein
MLVTIGTRPTSNSDHPADLLLACHGRIRGFMATARALATRDAVADESVRESALAVDRYFTHALPLHSADEDESIAPRLKQTDERVEAALATLTPEHVAIDARLRAMCSVVRAIAEEPSSRLVHRDALLAFVNDLDAQWLRHLALEESLVVPAVRALPASEIDAIRSEMRARRAR